MANTQDIRTRIASVKNTQQTTRAMKLVSAAKFRRAQAAILNARPYSRAIRALAQEVAATGRIEHFLFTKRAEVKKVLLVLISSDRGLCGGFNGSIIKLANNHYQEIKDSHEKVDFMFIGKRGADFFTRRGHQGRDVILNLAKEVQYSLASSVARLLVEMFQSEEYDEIRFIYNEFKTALQSEVVVETLLPIQPPAQVAPSSVENSNDFIFKPAPENMIEELLKRHFSAQVFRCMLESLAAEHAARMNAMENATKNAGEMIRSLALKYNKIRQAAITTELTEITSGAEALNN